MDGRLDRSRLLLVSAAGTLTLVGAFLAWQKWGQEDEDGFELLAEGSEKEDGQQRGELTRIHLATDYQTTHLR
jgi:hypothetical protein